jgi:hypothetical protein
MIGAGMRTVLSKLFLSLAVGVGLIVPVTGVPQNVVSSVTGTADEIHWTFTGLNSVSFDWRGTATEVHYGLSSAYGAVAIAQPPSPIPFSSSGPFWEAELTGLQPNVVYHYSIGSAPDQTFRTPPQPGTEGFTIDAEGDIGGSNSFIGITGVQRLIADDLPAFVLILGDLTYGNETGQSSVDQHFNDVMVWSQNTAYMPAWGNHEWDIAAKDDLRNYKGRFELPHQQMSANAPSQGCCGKDWYWFDYGNVRFIAYPEPYGPGTLSDWYSKAAELMDQGEHDPNLNFIVTFGHRPAYSSGYHPGDPVLNQYLSRLASHSKYRLNVNGHSHNYERSYPQHGVVHITAGTGGSELEENATPCLFRVCPAPSWSAYRAMHFGVLKLHFTRGEIRGEFVCGPDGGGKNDVHCTIGSVVDRFTIAARRERGHRRALHSRLLDRQVEGFDICLSSNEELA